MIENEMVGWHHQFNGHEFEQTQGDSEGQLLIAPERMKHLGQSGNNTQLWMCLVMKVKSDAVRTVLHRNLEC